jgi:hypothetical protein
MHIINFEEFVLHKIVILEELIGFWSLNPYPTERKHVRRTPDLGFLTIESIESLKGLVGELLNQEMNYFSSMIPKPKLGKLIRIASQEDTDEAKADKFLQLIRRI